MIKKVNIRLVDANINDLSLKELKTYNGGGFITEVISWISGAWSVHSQRIQMSSAERAAFIDEHGLRDHY